MNHYNKASIKQAHDNLNVEFGTEFAEIKNMKQRSNNSGDITAKAAGGITKRLVEIGELLMMHQGNRN